MMTHLLNIRSILAAKPAQVFKISNIAVGNHSCVHLQLWSLSDLNECHACSVLLLINAFTDI